MFLPDTDTTCPIHQQELMESYVLIMYGLIRSNDPCWKTYFEVEKSLFPMSNFFTFGGCTVQRKALRKIRYCVQCREAHIQWYKQNNCTVGLAQGAKEYARALISGNSAPKKIVPEEVISLLKGNRFGGAVKLLKQVNPQIEIGDLKEYTYYLKEVVNLGLC